MAQSLVVLVAIISILICSRLLSNAWHGQRLASRVGSVVILLSFASAALISIQFVHLRLDDIAPNLSLYLVHVAFITGASGILFNVLSQRRHTTARAMTWVFVMWSSVMIATTWMYMLDIVHAPPIDWSNLNNNSPTTLGRAVFSSIMLIYMIIACSFASYHQWRQYQLEISPYVRGRLATSIISVGATTFFFLFLLVKYLFGKILGVPLPQAMFQIGLPFSSLVSTVACLLWVWSPRALAWPWSVQRANALAPLQDYLSRFYSPLYLPLPRRWERWIHPDQCLSQTLGYVMDGSRLLATHDDPEARRLAGQLRAASVNDLPFDEAIQECIRISDRMLTSQRQG